MTARVLGFPFTILMGILSDIFKIHRKVLLAEIVGLVLSVVMIFCGPDIKLTNGSEMEGTIFSECHRSNAVFELCHSASQDLSSYKFARFQGQQQNDTVSINTTDTESNCILNCNVQAETVSENNISVENDIASFPLTLNIFSNQVKAGYCACGNCSMVALPWQSLQSHNVTCGQEYNVSCVFHCGSQEDSARNGTSVQELLGSVEYWLLFIAYFLFIVFFVASIAQSNTVCMALLGQENRQKYGQQRMWGNLGWGVSGIACGALIDTFSTGQPGINYTPLYIVVIVLLLLSLLVTLQIDFTLPAKKFKAVNVSKVICSIEVIIFEVSYNFRHFANSGQLICFSVSELCFSNMPSG